MNAKLPMVLVVLACGRGFALSQVSAPFAEATVQVQTRIEPQIAISEPAVVIVDLQDHLLGTTIPSRVRFRVRANTQEVELQVACTDLYRAGDPTSADRIPVADPGARITSESEDARLLAWQNTPSTDVLPAGWTGEVSEVGLFIAASDQVFSQDVSVDVAWNASDLTLPTGEYQGIVRLIGMVRP
ncbi:MAG: hypothetical protein ABFE01_07025 [Phycisphaerales bacterium]